MVIVRECGHGFITDICITSASSVGGLLLHISFDITRLYFFTRDRLRRLDFFIFTYKVAFFPHDASVCGRDREPIMPRPRCRCMWNTKSGSSISSLHSDDEQLTSQDWGWRFQQWWVVPALPWTKRNHLSRSIYGPTS